MEISKRMRRLLLISAAIILILIPFASASLQVSTEVEPEVRNSRYGDLFLRGQYIPPEKEEKPLREANRGQLEQTNVIVEPYNIKDYAYLRIGEVFGLEHWDSFHALVVKESGWKNTAQNPTSTAYGLCQFLNSTWAGTGYTKTSDPYTQIDACLVYILNRYQNPTNALNFHIINNYY